VETSSGQFLYCSFSEFPLLLSHVAHRIAVPVQEQFEDSYHKFNKYSFIFAMLLRYGIARPKGLRWWDLLSLAILEQQFKDSHHKFKKYSFI
jgi:hypothetical protein